MTAPLAGKRLLLVDENADVAGLVADATARLGADVTVLDTGRALLDVLAERAPDLAVIDLPLADVPGSDVLAALRRAGVPAIAVSGVYRGARAADDVRRLGAADFFEKPFPVDGLVASAARLLGVTLPGLDEAHDEVTGSTPLAEAEQSTVAAGIMPALDEPPDRRAAPAPAAGFETRIAEPPRARPATEMPPPRRGDLAKTTVPRLLVALHVAQATGALTLVRGPVKKILAVERGAPVYAASNVAGERFGALCVRRGLVTQERLDALRAERPAARTAELLAGAGLLAPGKRAELIAGQIRGIVWSTFEWREGSYDFQLARPPEGRVPISLPMGDLVLDGMRRASTLPRLRLELPASTHLAPSPAPAFELFALRLRPTEAQVLAVADGTKEVRDLVALADLPEREALAFLQACRVMRVLDEVERVLASSRRIGFM